MGIESSLIRHVQELVDAVPPSSRTHERWDRERVRVSVGVRERIRARVTVRIQVGVRVGVRV